MELLKQQPIQPVKAVTHENIIQKHAVLLYLIIRRIAPASVVTDVMSELINSAEFHLKKKEYSKYTLPLALRILINEVISPDFPLKTDELFNELSKDDILLLILRDAYNLKIYDLASAFSTSEGSIRTRLVLIREKIFTSSIIFKEHLDSFNSQPGIKLRHEIEDTDLTLNLTSLRARCAFNSDFQKQLELRFKSHQYFSSYTEPIVPSNLHEMINPTLIEKKGDKVKLNLSTAPWYYKIIFEAILSIIVVASIVIAMPRVKKAYEFWVERRLDIYNFAETQNIDEKTTPEQDSSSIKQGLSEISTENSGSVTPEIEETPVAHSSPISIQSEFSNSRKDSEKASSDKIYRILISTDAPEIAKRNIQTLLSSLEGSTPREGVVGTELPGGIMFDVYIPLNAYGTTFKQLSSIGKIDPYITKPKQEKIIPGKVHLKIWLQRQ